MIRRPTFLQALRQERHPLALLAMLAVSVRVSIIMIGLALSPEAAAAGVGIICQTPIQNSATGSPVVHDPAHCICGSVCIHTGHFAATADTYVPWQPDNISQAGSVLPVLNANQTLSAPRNQAAIRAPPHSLI